MSIMLNTKKICIFCKNKKIQCVYKPINSKRNMSVYICNNCGTLFSLSKSNTYTSNPPPNLSVDADRSSIFYTKDIECEYYTRIINKILNKNTKLNILDIGSNRGAIYNYFTQFYKNIIYHAVEPNKYISKNYKKKVNRFYQSKFEDANVDDNYYNFCICVHTLEHFNNPLEMLMKIFNTLKFNGKFLLSVPSTDIGVKSDIISEYFIDTHNFHFNRSNLKKFLISIGFKIIYSNSINEDSITLICEKTKFYLNSEIKIKKNKTLVNSNITKIKKYKNIIQDNRAKLKNIAKYLNNISKKKKIVIWGAGRIFDGLIKIGNLDRKSISYLTDKYLHNYKSRIHNIKLIDPKKLSKINKKNMTVFVSSIAYAAEIENECIKLGFNNIIKFNINVKNFL